jgi:hypothetical protein
LIVVVLRSGARLEHPAAVAVVASTFPTMTGDTPAKALNVVTADGRVLASFRVAEVAGYSIGPIA